MYCISRRAIALGIWSAIFLWYSTGSKFMGQTQFGIKGTYRELVTCSTTFKISGEFQAGKGTAIRSKEAKLE